MYYAQPLEDNLFEWHFTILAPEGTDFEGGHYHGRILLPTEYPMKPPSIIMLTVSTSQLAGELSCTQCIVTSISFASLPAKWKI